MSSFRYIFYCALLFATTMPFFASSCASLEGPLFFYEKGKLPNAIIQAFDLPFTKKIERLKTFPGEDTTPVKDQLSAFKAKGYTHIQISPPQACKPAYSELSPMNYDKKDIWYLPYQPYACVFDDAYKDELSGVFNKGSVDLRSQYGITLDDGTIIGFRLGNTRYGTVADLRELVVAAKSIGLKIIADVVVNHVSPDHAGPHKRWWKDKYNQRHKDKNMGIKDLHPIVYNPTTGTFSLSPLNFPDNFFHKPGKGSYGLTTWDWGPDLNTGDDKVQEMIVKYLKMLRDLEIEGIRFDAMKHIAASEFRSIFQKAEALIGKENFFTFGYGEVADSNYAVLKPYFPVCSIKDFVLCSSTGPLVSCFARGESVKTLVAPKGNGNRPGVVFSLTHDGYPGVATMSVMPYYANKNPNDPRNIINSQMAIAYLLSKRDGAPLILRFENEKDFAGILERALDFRAKMQNSNAPHEYVKAINDSVLLIARQHGFAVINKGRTDYVLSKDDIRSSSDAFLPFYIPDGVYTDKSEKITCSVPDISITVARKNVAFFTLKDTAGKESVEQVFETSAKTHLGERIFVVGNHPLLGEWSPRKDGFNGLMCRQSFAESGSIYPLWKSLGMRFPKGASLKYKYVKAKEDGKIKEWLGDADKEIVTGS